MKIVTHAPHRMRQAAYGCKQEHCGRMHASLMDRKFQSPKDQFSAQACRQELTDWICDVHVKSGILASFCNTSCPIQQAGHERCKAKYVVACNGDIS